MEEKEGFVHGLDRILEVDRILTYKRESATPCRRGLVEELYHCQLGIKE